MCTDTHTCFHSTALKFFIMGNSKHRRRQNNTMSPIYPIPIFNNRLMANIASSLFQPTCSSMTPMLFEANTRCIISSINISVSKRYLKKQSYYLSKRFIY